MPYNQSIIHQLIYLYIFELITSPSIHPFIHATLTLVTDVYAESGITSCNVQFPDQTVRHNEGTTCLHTPLTVSITVADHL